MLPANYRIRFMEDTDYDEIITICKLVYPTETPYTHEELEEHRRVFPQGQFVAVNHSAEDESATVAGVHFTLRLKMKDFHIDDPWDILTARGTFEDHDPEGTSLYGADIMVHPHHQHHGLAHGLTDCARSVVIEEKLWRMVGASRLPGYSKCHEKMTTDEYVAAVLRGDVIDPVLTAHLKDGWIPVRPIKGYLQHDEESLGWAEVIQWINPDCPPPVELDLTRLPTRANGE